MIDLNDLRIFAYVAALTSFSLAADALQIHKSSVSRSIARLEAMLHTPLILRTTRKVLLTQSGIDLSERCAELLSRVNETIGYAGSVGAMPRAAAAKRTLLRSPASLPARVDATRASRRHDAGQFGAVA
ncbi:helix-turn-helix domain-containing protein [Variovorax saccharolyticus]|uniref:helix-turn-helix domain-containing protein n=1 Tax=Variovorax saccharolyticus TaxID=3053516 RepID=UPI002577C1CF|nr:LysR family transcriptional regulator [Variovorax sp. J22R187]MDM0018934.1 LysR family transcriptional regulator [Variovorax sp. J22R187]